jgi:hypothetical protein
MCYNSILKSIIMRNKDMNSKKIKPRNYVVLAMIHSNKHSAVHVKSKKAVRQQDKINLKKGKDHDGK